MTPYKKPPLANLFKILFSMPPNMAEMFDIILEKNHPIVRLIHFHRIYLLNDPSEGQRILQNPGKIYIKHGIFIERVRMPFGDGLATSEGRLWEKQRELLQPEFYPKKLASFMTESAQIINTHFNETWQSFAKKRKTFDIAEEMTYLVLKMTAQALFSTDFGKNTKKILSCTEFCQKFINGYYYFPPHWPSYHRWKYHQITKKFIHPTITSLIEERRTQTDKPDDLLTTLINAIDPDTHKPYSQALIRDQIITLMVTGHETTGALLGWLWYELGTNPDIYHRVSQEVETVLSNKMPTLSDLAQLKYLRIVIDEALRLYPTIWCIPRFTLQEDIIAGYKIPKHSTVLINPYHFHRHANLWENPLLFNPERFNRENIENKPKIAYYPFGMGHRVCIGRNLALQQMMLLLVMTLKRYDVISLTKKLPQKIPLVSMKPRGGIKVRIRQK